MSLRALYIDFDAYFVSVEQQLRPELRNKPVAVLPVAAETTCCIAASYEAKAHGIRTGTSVREARRLCPSVTFVEARPALYVDFHHRLTAAVESCAHVEKVLSIDEMYCSLSGSLSRRGQALSLAQGIKHAVCSAVGSQLKCSIGIAPNVFLAKTASEMQKPDGLTVIETHQLPECLFGLELRDLCGIGPRMEKRLLSAGIHSIAQLCKASKAELRHVWGGVNGERMHARLRGDWIPDLPAGHTSIGHSHVLPPALRSHTAAWAVLHRLLQKSVSRLRNRGMMAGKLRVQVRMVNGLQWDRRTRLDPSQDTRTFIRAFRLLWQNYPASSSMLPLAVGITLLELDIQKHQTRSLFDDVDAGNRLNATIDKVNARHGRDTIYFGGAHRALKAAPMRIAFNHIPDPGTEGD